MSALAGRAALVTGASRGIGRAIAFALGNAGASVLATATSQAGADEVARALQAKGIQARGAVYQSGDPRSADALAAQAGAVDILVSNAGTVVRKPLAEMGDDDFDRVLAVNLSGPFHLARRLVPGMVQRGWGRVIHISSISATLGTPRLTGYCASKWGLNGFTKALAEELRGTGVLTAAVMPGSVDTDMLKGSGFSPQLQPEEVADVVRYLCAEAPPSMNGSLVELFG